MNLTQWQQQLVASIDGERADESQGQWLSRGRTPGLDVYRNNCDQALVGALESTFPICLTILGEDYFRKLCRQYASEYPCGSNGLNDYGETFFNVIEMCLEHSYLSTDFAYLPDLVKLEWIMQKTFYAKPSRVFDIQSFSQLAEEQQYRVVFELSDECHYLSSEFALCELWQRHHLGLDSIVIEQPADQYFMCVYRRKYKAVVCRLNEGEFSVLCAIAKASTMENLAKLPLLGGDLSCIPLFIQRNWIDSFTVLEANNV